MSSERIQATAADGMAIVTPDRDALATLEAQVIDENGRPRVVPASVFAGVDQANIAALCVKHAFYGVVTCELVEFIREQINGRCAIEIGAGNGVLAEALNITGVDNRMQDWPWVRATYEMSQQPTVRYGANVVHMDGIEALSHYRPQVVIGNWLTHFYRPERHWAGGNMYAPDERQILENVETFILVGNSKTHAGHSLLDNAHDTYEPSWLYSRAVRGTNFVKVWLGGAS